MIDSFTSTENTKEISSSIQSNGDIPETVQEVEEAIEAGTDLFWDSVADIEDRTQALAVPNTFKRQLTRPY